MIRKILSKSEQEKKRKRNSIIIGVILMIVMFGSVFGVVVGSFGKNSSGKNKMEYNGYEFFNENGLWKVSAGEINFIFTYFPTETKNITNILKNVNNYYNQPLYVYSKNAESKTEIYRNLQQIALRIQSACFNNETCEGDFPIKTCSDNFIIIEEGIEEITQIENCVYITGENSELLKLTDSFLYKIFGIK